MRELSILAIDDDDIDLESLQRNLSACEGYTVHFRGYQNWKQGLDEHAERPADIIFLDFFLGNTTGSELLRELRDRGDLQPVIMLTGQGDEGTATESIRFGASDYIAKNKLTPDVLVRAIETAHREYQLRMENAYLEQELRASRHLEAIGTLAGGVAHDFNNFLAGILSSSELALSYEPEERVAKELERIAGIVRNAADVIRRLLQFNKFYAGAGENGAIDVRDVVCDTFKILEHSCPKGIEISITCDKNDETLFVLGSSARMHQIVLNVCVNAIEAMEAEGCLAISVAKIRSEDIPGGNGNGHSQGNGLGEGDYVRLTIADTGPGIPEDVRERMFDPFFTTKGFGTQKGTGLGLATVWDCVREMHGTIRVDSELGNGTEFHIYLPSCGPHITPERRNGTSETRGTETILLVDDEPEILHTTAELLRRLGYTVHSASSGEEALERIAQHRNDLSIVVLDISMPGMDGKETLQRIRHEDVSLPVLMATGFSAVSEGEKVRALGALGVVQKPYSIRNLAVQIRSTLAQVQQRAE